MVLVIPSLASIWYCGIIKIWEGSIICTSTMVNSRFLPLNCSLAKANPAAEENATAQSTRNRISSVVLKYSRINGRLVRASS